MKTVSILIAAWRAQDWLKDCLDAVFAQVLPDGWRMQVLLGIDGCADTYNFMQGQHYPALGLVHLKQNHGTYITFNSLLAWATGELICRFDADDVMQPGYLSAQIDAIQAGCDLTMTWSIYTDDKLRPTSHVLAHTNYHPAGGLNRYGSEGQFMIRREAMQRLGGFRPWRCGADSDFLNRVRAAGFKECVLEAFLYLRRTHAQSLIAHKDTNFESPYRIERQELTRQYLQQYQAGELDCRVEPTCASDVDYLEPAHHA